jgi:hypothetical protein
MALQPIIGHCPPLYWYFLITHNQTHGRTPLDEWSARRRGLYLHSTTSSSLWLYGPCRAFASLTQHNTTYKHKRQTSMPRAGFEPHDPSNQAAADLSLRSRGHWDRQRNNIQNINSVITVWHTYFIMNDIQKVLINAVNKLNVLKIKS